MNQDRFSAFLRKDLAAALEAIDVLNGGVHGLDSSLSDAQARLLMLRIDHLLAFLLEVSKIEAKNSPPPPGASSRRWAVGQPRDQL